MSTEQWHDLTRWTGIGGLVVLLLVAVATLSAVVSGGDPEAKPERDKIAALTAVFLGAGTAVLLNASNVSGGPAVFALVAAGAALVIGGQVWLARRALQLRRRDTDDG